MYCFLLNPQAVCGVGKTDSRTEIAVLHLVGFLVPEEAEPTTVDTHFRTESESRIRLVTTAVDTDGHLVPYLLERM